MGYILYFGQYLTSTTMIGGIPWNSVNTEENAGIFSKATFDGFSKTWPGGIFIPMK